MHCSLDAEAAAAPPGAEDSAVAPEEVRAQLEIEALEDSVRKEEAALRTF